MFEVGEKGSRLERDEAFPKRDSLAPLTLVTGGSRGVKHSLPTREEEEDGSSGGRERGGVAEWWWLLMLLLLAMLFAGASWC